METEALVDLVRCHLGVVSDPNRVGLVLDYRGDRPPLELFELLRRYGWLTPVPYSPPAKAIDWDRPDPHTGSRWSLRPFLVIKALAVPGPAAADWALTQGWLERALEGFGIPLTGERVEVVSLREPLQGRLEMVSDDAGASIDPFVPAAARQVPPVPRETVVNGAPPIARSPEALVPIGGPPTDLVEAPSVPVAASQLIVDDDRAGSPLVWTAADPVVHKRTICAVIRPGAIGKVLEVLEEMGLEDVAVLLPVEGYGRGGGQVIRFRGQRNVEPLHRLQLQLPVDPSSAEEAVARLVEVSRLGEKGDGKIWVT